ncbi:MAG: HAD hydrolase family protein, partial [Chitinispirillales bacterium]|nr:HAD hydrolase family protein [Chitinispirillales bacterium]
DTAVFGDEQNDIPMLKLSGLGIAMKNASLEVKSFAKRVTEKTNDEDGIACEWERMKRLY